MAPDGGPPTGRTRREMAGLLMMTAVFLLAMGGIGAAVYTRMPGLRGESPDELLAAGQARANVGDGPGAMDLLGKAIATDPGASDPYVVRGDVAFRFGDFRAAIADYTSALERDDDDRRAYVGRARARHAIGAFDGAMADYTTLIEREPDNAILWRRRGQLGRVVGAWDGAVADIMRAYELNPRLRRIDNDLAWAHWGVFDYESALDAFDRSVERTSALHEFFGRGVTLYHLGLLVEAHADLLEAGTRSGSGNDYAQYYLWLTRARLGERERADEGLRAFIEGPGRGTLGGWSPRIAAFLLGDTSEEQFLEEAASARWQAATEQQCEAFFYAGTMRLIEGDAAGATELLERSVATGQVNYYEYHSARVELASLAAP